MASLLDYLLGSRQASAPAETDVTPVVAKDALPAGDARAVTKLAVVPKPEGPPIARSDGAAVARLQEALASQQGFNKRVSTLASRTSLSPEDVMAEALRFADRHSEAFQDFIYKGGTNKPARGNAGTGQFNTIIGMTFLLGILITLIVVLGSG